MIKLINILREDEEQKPKKILVPRRIKQRNEKRLQIDLQNIQKYIEEGSRYSLYLQDSPINKLPDNLTEVNGTLWLTGSKIEDLNNLKYVSGNLYLSNTPISSLPNNLKVGGNLFLQHSNISSLPHGLVVERSLILNNNPIYSLPKDLQVGKSLFIKNTPLAGKYSDEQIKEMCPGIKRKIFSIIGI